MEVGQFFFPWRLSFAVAGNEGKQLWKPSLAKNEEIVFALWTLCCLDDRTVLCYSSPQQKSKTFSLHLWPYLKGWFAAQNPWNISWQIHTCGRYKEENKKGLGGSHGSVVECMSLSYYGVISRLFIFLFVLLQLLILRIIFLLSYQLSSYSKHSSFLLFISEYK